MEPSDDDTDDNITGASIVVGLLLVVVAGGLNGSWNAAFSPTHGLAVGRLKTTIAKIEKAARQNDDDDDNDNDNDKVKVKVKVKQEKEEEKPKVVTPPSPTPSDLNYHEAWTLFQVYSALINIPICIWWVGGPARVQWLVQETEPLDLGLVIIFSILWGGGSVGFGLACQVAGVGLGTNLCMGTIMILGTFLPLCLDGAISTPAGGVVLGGLSVCCVGLGFSIQSLQARRDDEAQRKPSREEGGDGNDRIITRRRTMFNTTVSLSFRKQDDDNDNDTNTNTNTNTNNKDSSAAVVEDMGEKVSDEEIPPKEDGIDTSTLYKVAVCVIAGVFASQLQFAFVFGSDIVDLAASSEGPGSTPPSGTSALIWLFAISLGAPPSIIYGLWGNRTEGTSLLKFVQCPWYRHLLILVTTSIPWVAHIHLYGYSTTLLPDDLGASVAWPTLMMMTVVTGMLWSIGLGEWTHANARAKTKLHQGLAVVTLGVGVIMSSIAV